MDRERSGPAATEWRRGRRLGVDLGKARIGIAVCDPDGILATPVATVRRDMRTGGEEIPNDIREIAEIASEYDVVEIVVGLPVTLSGEEGLAAEHTRTWVQRLSDRVSPVPVMLTDERLTTAVATRRLNEGGVRGKRKRSIVDQAAAVEILQHWLDQRRRLRHTMLGDLDSQAEHADAPRRHRRRESGSSLIAMTLVVALFGVLGVGGWWAYNHVIKDYFIAEDYEGTGNGTEVTVTIEEGWFVADIAGELYDQGVVASAKAFTDASADDGDSGTAIQPGTYVMQEEMSAASALAFLTDPANRMANAVTIPEGYTSMEIYDALSKHTGVPIEDFQAAAEDPEALGVDPLWFEGFGDRQIKSVEGFLFPATYEFDEKMTAEQMLSAMVAKFNETVAEIGFIDKAAQIQDPDPDYDPGAYSMPDQIFNPPTNGEFKVYPWMALQIAAIVQSESGVPEDDAKIAQVMYNRLSFNWFEGGELRCNCLHSEAIWNYGRQLNGEEPITSGEDVEWGELMVDGENPWAPNAKENAGYFPSAIANPGVSALEAAVNPEAGDWLYFVTAYEDGRALFAETLDEHNENVHTAEENGIQ